MDNLDEVESTNNIFSKTFKDFNVKILTEEKDNKKIYYLFKAADIGKVLGIKNMRSSIQDFNNEESIIRNTYTIGGNQKTLFLTEKGIKRLICSSRKVEAVKFAIKLGINVNYKYVASEISFIIAIKKAFKGEDIQLQYPIDKYRLDLYFPEYKLAIEFDENSHRYRNPQDLARERFIKEKINCNFIRIKEKSDIFDNINEIYNYIIFRHGTKKIR